MSEGYVGRYVGRVCPGYVRRVCRKGMSERCFKGMSEGYVGRPVGRVSEGMSEMPGPGVTSG